MYCPKCGNELDEYFFEPESWYKCDELYHILQLCPSCGMVFNERLAWEYMKPSDCRQVQNGEIDGDDFDKQRCIGCLENCVFAKEEENGHDSYFDLDEHE